MILSAKDSDLFFKLHGSLLFYVNNKLDIISKSEFKNSRSTIFAGDARQIVFALLENMGLIDQYANENPEGFEPEEVEIVRSWRDMVYDKFFIYRQLKKHTIFLPGSSSQIAFGVVGLTDPIEVLMGGSLPKLVETVLLPFKGQIIYDGILSSHSVKFDKGIKTMLDDAYRAAKENKTVIATLPSEFVKIVPAASRHPEDPNEEALKTQLLEIIEKIHKFCDKHLDEDYAELCVELLEEYAELEPTAFIKTKPESWAAGIVRTIGWVNFLSDSSIEPYMKLADIDKAFGVSTTTGSSKSMQIRARLDLVQFDPNWTLPCMEQHNPLFQMTQMALNEQPSGTESSESGGLGFLQSMAPMIFEKMDSFAEEYGEDNDDPLELTDELYQFKITLKNISPPIWRCIQVKDCTLDNFHTHLQACMGWEDEHMHIFEAHGDEFVPPEALEMGYESRAEIYSTTMVTLSNILHGVKAKFRFTYTYDFGDDWVHEIIFEGQKTPDPEQKYPLCLKGKQACPPEDSGGPLRYPYFLDALKDPDHEMHEECIEFYEDFDPGKFDAEEKTTNMRQWMSEE